MCGSGTILIEAALLACKTAPGLLRYSPNTDKDSYLPCGTSWLDVDKSIWSDVYQNAAAKDRRSQQQSVFLYGNDIHMNSIALAQQAARQAGVDKLISFTNTDISFYKPAKLLAVILSNTPWDQRIEGAEAAWHKLSDFFTMCRSYKDDVADDSAANMMAFILSGNQRPQSIQHVQA